MGKEGDQTARFLEDHYQGGVPENALQSLIDVHYDELKRSRNWMLSLMVSLPEARLILDLVQKLILD